MLTLRTLRIVARLAAQDLGNTNITIAIKKGKKADKQLTQLKKALMVKQPVKSQSLYDQYHHRQIYKRIDTDLQAFFYKRQYTLENFNFLVNLLGHQKKLTFIPEVLRKMKIMNIEPDQRTYNYMIRAAAEEGDIVKAQYYLKQASQRFGEGKHFYTSLMQAYAKKNDPDMAYKIVQEMFQRGIQPDLPVYTTLINAFRIGRKLQKCWEIHRQMVKSKVELDQVYVGAMMKVYAATHDAELAIKLYKQNILLKNVKPMLQTTNSYLKALSSRPEYSMMVIDKFFNMTEEGYIFNEETLRWALKACSTTANIKSAIEIIKIMKLKNIEPNVQIYNSLIRVYAKACDVPQLSEKYREMMLTDTWKLLEEIISKNMLDTSIVNNVMLVYANALQQDKIQGLILPLYQKFNLEMNPYTFQILVNLYYEKKDFNTAIRVWNQMKDKLEQKKQKEVQKRGGFGTNLQLLREDLRPTFNLLETYIQIGIRMMDMNMVLQALDMFKKLKRHPKNSTLKFLGTLKNLPIEIQTSLMDFQIRFGAAKLAKTRSQSQKNVPDPQSR